MTADTGRVVRVNGPVVHLAGLGPAARFELVEVGAVDTPGLALSVDVAGTHAYVADKAFGLQVIDISNAAARLLVGAVMHLEREAAAVAAEPAGLALQLALSAEPAGRQPAVRARGRRCRAHRCPVSANARSSARRRARG